MASEVARVLREARELISAPERWTQGVCARDAEGASTACSGPDARQWCALGAVWRITRISERDRPDEVVRLEWATERFLERAVPSSNPPRVNDTGTHADVLAMYDRAIELAEADGG